MMYTLGPLDTMSVSVEGNYKVKVFKRDGDYLAEVIFPDGSSHYTQGTDKTIFYMVGDLISTCYDIEISWWKRIIIKLFSLCIKVFSKI